MVDIEHGDIGIRGRLVFREAANQCQKGFDGAAVVVLLSKNAAFGKKRLGGDVLTGYGGDDFVIDFNGKIVAL